LESLAGRVALLVVPAEEFIEIEYRDGLRSQSKLEFLGGKSEFVKLGVMDDVDIAMMTHTENQDWRYTPGTKLGVGANNNGMIAKRIQFNGVASHAGGSPHLGVNALNAANIALMAIHAQRETFRDDESIRIHPIITKGGTVVSSVPADVRMETFVRGSTIESYMAAGKKVDRALRAGAMAVGASVDISTIPGYTPLAQDETLTEIYVSNAAQLVGADKIARMGHRSGSTDMGDISQIMPAIHPYVAAATGKAHGNDYVVLDYELAVTTAGKAMAMTIVDLLFDDAQRANSIVRDFQGGMTRSGYLSWLRDIYSEETYTE
ncbi:MAG: peptidase dimerization domain-containing protein, partial [Dehalococcoidia bacterium]|nr:peptidase dimerization domain-containing protein [Dehalococcoidia bacterium]